MMFPEAARPPRQSFLEVPSTVFWLPVMEWTVVIRPSLMPKASWRTLATGARQLVVQEALETKSMLVVIGCVVHAHDEHRGIVLGRGGEKDLFGPAGQVPLHFFRGGEFSGALHDVLCPHRGPGNLVGLLTVEHPDPAAVHDEVVPLPAHLALEAAVDAVIF